MKYHEQIYENLNRLRTQAPLIHNITNYVVMNTTANCLLAAGASPVMAHAIEEVEEMTSISGALVINIGTLDASWVKSMEKAMKTAKEQQIPIVLDPVGAGATSYRTQVVHKLLDEFPPDILRGNASEISALYSEHVQTKGVDSIRESSSAVKAARYLSDRYECVTVISGATDYVIGGQSQGRVFNGCALMGKITGMGCMATALAAGFTAVCELPFDAALSAMAVMGIAGEMAEQKSAGPGTFHPHFLDALYHMEQNEIEKRLKLDTGNAS